MFLESYNPATDDLYTYDASNSGWPTGWNPSHALYPYRSQLQWIGVAKRQVDVNSESFHSGSPGGPGFDLPPVMPGGTPLAQRPNYYTWIFPTLTFIDARLAVGAMHFWDSLAVNRDRPASLGIWSSPPLRWLMADGTLVANKANADFRGTWNTTPGFVNRAPQDNGLAEYEGPNPSTASMPVLILPTAEAPISAWMIERQGRAVPVTIDPKGPDSPRSTFYRGVWTSTRDYNLATYDSGNVFVAVIGGTVYGIGHQREGNDEIAPGGVRTGRVQCWANRELMDGPYLATLGHSTTRVKRQIVGAAATQTTALDILATLEGAI